MCRSEELDLCQPSASPATFCHSKYITATCTAAARPLPLAPSPQPISGENLLLTGCLRAEISNLGVGCVLLEISVDGGCCALE